MAVMIAAVTMMMATVMTMMVAVMMMTMAVIMMLMVNITLLKIYMYKYPSIVMYLHTYPCTVKKSLRKSFFQVC